MTKISTSEESIELFRRTRQVDGTISSMMKRVRAEEQAEKEKQALLKAEALLEERQLSLETKILTLDLNTQRVNQHVYEMQDYLTKLWDESTLKSEKIKNLDYYKEHRQIMGRILPLINYLFAESDTYKDALAEMEEGVEFTTLYLRQSISYTYQYLNQNIRPQLLISKLQGAAVPDELYRRYERYVNTLSSSYEELSWRLQRILQNLLSSGG